MVAGKKYFWLNVDKSNKQFALTQLLHSGITLEMTAFVYSNKPD